MKWPAMGISRGVEKLSVLLAQIEKRVADCHPEDTYLNDRVDSARNVWASFLDAAVEYLPELLHGKEEEKEADRG